MTEPRRRAGRSGVGWVLAALCALLLLGFWLWFDANFARQWREIQVGASAEARRNPFLAAERLLLRLGADVRGAAGASPLRQLPDPGALIISDGLPPLNAERRRRLWAWLDAGGHLLVEAVRLEEDDAQVESTDFLRELGAVLRQTTTVAAGDEVVAQVRLPGSAEVLEVAFSAPWSVEDISGNAVAEATAAGRARLLRYRVGAGAVVVVSDTGWLANAAIGRHDHALLLALLAAERSSVWLLHDLAMPHLAVLLWRAAPAALFSAGLLLLALLWHFGGRLGPLLPEPPTGRRDLLEHLDAAGAFMWRLGRGAHLVQCTRRRLERDWLLRHPPLQPLDPQARARRIAEHSHLPVSQVHAALYGPLGDGRELPRITATLQRLRLH
jgi:hypothetical protein